MSSELRLPFRARIGRPADRAAIESTFDRARTGEWAVRLAARDTTLWSSDPAVQEKIANRLGWLDAPEHFTTEIPALTTTLRGLGRVEPCGSPTTLVADTSPDCIEISGAAFAVARPSLNSL